MENIFSLIEEVPVLLLEGIDFRKNSQNRGNDFDGWIILIIKLNVI